MRTRTVRTETRRHDRRDPHRRTSEDRVREAGGPEDHAFYSCDCGYSFAGDVSTHVACPKCGTEQSW